MRRIKTAWTALKRIHRLFGPHLRPHRRRMVVAWLCMLGATLAYLAQPWILKIIFDYALIPTEVAANTWLGRFDTTTLVAGASVALLLIALLRGAFGYGQAYLSASIGQQVVADIRSRVFSHIQRLSQDFHDEQHSGDLLFRLTSDIQLLRDMLVNAILQITERLLVLVAVAGLMLWLDWRLALVGLAVIPALALVSSRTSSKIREAVRKQRRREGHTTNVLSETLSALPIIQAYGREDWEEARFQHQHQSSLKAGLRVTRFEARLARVVEVILAAGTAAVLWLGASRVISGALTPGDLLVFTAYLTTLYKPIRKLSSLTARLAKAGVCTERLAAILQTQPKIQDLPHARPAPPLQGHIQLEAVTFGYRPETPVLKQADLTIEPGETVALVGPSGCGKSTLAKLLLRFYDPQEGVIRIDGHDIRDFTLASLRAQIAILLQQPYLFAMSVRDNIAYGRLDASDDDIRRAARLACAHEFIEQLPQGYDTVLGEGGASLSAGQRQRIAIARALVRDAPIVILDEPMTGLDPDSTAQVQQALDHLCRDRTCLIITHDLDAAMHADRTIRLCHGRFVEFTQSQGSLLQIQGRS